MTPRSRISVTTGKTLRHLAAAAIRLQSAGFALRASEGSGVVVAATIAPGGMVLVIGGLSVPSGGGDIARVIAGTMIDRRLLSRCPSSAASMGFRVVVLAIAPGSIALVVRGFPIGAGSGGVTRITARTAIYRSVPVVGLAIRRGHAPIHAPITR
jgi:hypothetical protein